MRVVLVDLPDHKALSQLLDRGEQDREFGPAPQRDLKDREWLTLTVRVGMRETKVAAYAVDLGDGPSLVLSERDWGLLRSFAAQCGEDSRTSHPPSGVTAIARGKVGILAGVPSLGAVVSRHLSPIGIEAMVWSSADEMIARLIEVPVDVVVVDAQICDVSCVALCKYLHGLEPERRPYVLTLVASSSPTTDVRAVTFGADDFLFTPYRVEELRARLTSLLHRASSERCLIGAA